MANPALENGYTPIANELMQQLCRLRMSGRQWQILIFLLRKTYGWNKKQDKISLSQFAKATGIAAKNVSRLLHQLRQRKIILQNKDSFISEYRFNQDYEQWKTVPENEVLSLKLRIKPA